MKVSEELERMKVGGEGQAADDTGDASSDEGCDGCSSPQRAWGASALLLALLLPAWRRRHTHQP